MQLLPLFALPGGPEVLLLLLIVVLMFGANRIPAAARAAGESVVEFRRGAEKSKQELEDMRENEPQNAGDGH